MTRSRRNSLRAIAIAASLVALPLAASSCASGRGGAEAGDAPSERPTTVIQVDNGNFADVVVYALGAGQYYRLGVVTGLDRSTLQLPRHLDRVTDLRLVVDPIGSGASYFSNEILFSPGDVLVLDVGPTMSLSSVSVRSGRGG